MAGSNGVISVIFSLGPTDNMLPPSADLRSSGDGDNIGRDRAMKARITGNVCAEDVLHRVVGIRGADSEE